MVNATMAPPAFPVPGAFQGPHVNQQQMNQMNMNQQLQMLHAMQQQVQQAQQQAHQAHQFQQQTNCMPQNAFNFVNFAANSGGLNGNSISQAQNDALFNSFKSHRPTQLALPPSPSPSPSAPASTLSMSSAASTTPGHSNTSCTPRTLSFPMQGDVSCGAMAMGGNNMTLVNALSCLTAAHIRATRDVVVALQQCPDLLTQPDFAFLREFIHQAQGVGIQQQQQQQQQQAVNVHVTPSMMPMNEVAPMPMRTGANLGVDTMIDGGCSPNSQMDVDINALLQALDFNNDVEFSASGSTSSTDVSTPISQSPQSTTTLPILGGYIPQQPMAAPQPPRVHNVPPSLNMALVSNQVGMPSGVPTTPTTNMSSAQPQPTTPSSDQAAADKAIIDPRKYKTRMCRNWQREGRCSYEHTCCFAHGEGELRNAAANITVLSSLGYFTSKQQEGQQPTTPTTDDAQVSQPMQQIQMPTQQQSQQGQQQNRRRQEERR